MSKNKKKEVIEIRCPKCGTPAKSRKDIFCLECDHGLFTPPITNSWSLKVILTIILVVVVFYLLFLIFKEPLYFMLDMV